ncbi:MAG: YwiC-like family protein [Actinomycetota bacterium]
MTAADTTATNSSSASLRKVALPSEHGGWGLTLEPGLLGLLVAPSWAGLCLAAAAFAAFLLRTPLKLALVDRRRGRDLERTRLARRVVVAEGAVLAGLVAGTVVLAGDDRWWIPLAAVVPIVLIEFWYEVRSRGRRLVPEVAGAASVAAVAPAIVIADGRSGGLAAALWLILVARIVTSIPHVREQIDRLHDRAVDPRLTRGADVAALIVAVVAALVDERLVIGAVAVAVVVVVQAVRRRRPLAPIAVIGVLQMVLGLAVVIAAAIGVAVV